MEWPTAATILGALTVLGGALLTFRLGNAKSITDRENAQTEWLNERITDLTSRLDKLERTSRAQTDYIAVLRGHVDAGLPPPPPPWPKELSL